MEGTMSSASDSVSAHELLILHTDEAQEWASYLQQILHSSQMFPRGSFLRYAVSAADRLHGYNFEDFRSCRCVVLILTAVFLDLLCDHELRGALQRLLSPPHKVVALLCGVSEEEVSAETFGDWPEWRKLHPEDEPAVYVSAILDSMADSEQAEVEHKAEWEEHNVEWEEHEAEGVGHEAEEVEHKAEWEEHEAEGVGHEAEEVEHEAEWEEHEAEGVKHEAEWEGHETEGVGHEATGVEHDAQGVEHEAEGVGHEAEEVEHEAEGLGHKAKGVEHEAEGVELLLTAASTTESHPSGQREEDEAEERKATEPKDDEGPTNRTFSSPADLTCLTVQPTRVLCGEHETLYIVLNFEVDSGSEPEVEFSSETVRLKRVPAAVLNAHTLSVSAPGQYLQGDVLPPGSVSKAEAPTLRRKLIHPGSGPLGPDPNLMTTANRSNTLITETEARSVHPSSAPSSRHSGARRPET